MAENRKMMAIRLPPELLDEFDLWCEAQRPRTTKTAIIEMLLEDFLAEQRRKGWKPARK